MTSRKGIGGRKPGLIDYRHVAYSGKEYTVATITFNENDIHFVVDKEDFPLLEERAWHFASGNYISSGVIHDDKKKELYLHNLIMNRLDHPGKGATDTVDHINRNGLDNRKENLRILSQSEQNLHQAKKKRSVVLPQGFPIDADEIPRHIWYVRANGLHGDRFAIEFKSEGIVWKTTSSKKISVEQKLNQAKEKLQELYITFPHLDPSNIKILEEELNTSYAKIIDLALLV